MDGSDNLIFVDPTPVARRLLWHLYSIGTRRLTEADRHCGLEKPGAHLFWVTSGEGELEYGSRRFRLHPGKEVWLVDMKSPRAYVPAPDSDLTLEGIRFGGPGLEFWHEEMREHENAGFALEDPAVGMRTQAELLRLVKRQDAGWEWQVHLAITGLLGLLLSSRELLTSPQPELPASVVRVLNAISTDPARSWKAGELAQVGRISYSGLRAQFHAAGKGTIHQNIQRVRLDRSRLLLADTRLSIKDVARRMNFSSEFYFSHFFRRQTGMTPTQYRLHLRRGAADKVAA
jgi:AraC-like DNA-binding protein